MTGAEVDGKASFSVWKPPSAGDAAAGKYIAVIGNTGSGKSTVVAKLRRDVGAIRPAVGIDERSTHHPFLDRLFHDPGRYSYELQLNFMIQRVLLVKRWLDAGFTVVMERSHLDDRIFIEHLKAQGLADVSEANAYLQVWSALASRMPLPDAVIALQVPVAVSVQRITRAEQTGARPCEYSSERQKVEWVTSWAEFYSARIAELSADPRMARRLMLADENTAYAEICSFVMRLAGPPQMQADQVMSRSD